MTVGFGLSFICFAVLNNINLISTLEKALKISISSKYLLIAIKISLIEIKDMLTNGPNSLYMS